MAKAQKKFPRGFLDLMATALLADDRRRTNEEIARILGCHARTLAPSNCPKLARMRALTEDEAAGSYVRGRRR